MEQKSKDYPSLDLAKFIASILVVTIHITPFGFLPAKHPLNLAFSLYMSRIAVPFFFVCAGYLFFSKIDINNYNWSYCKKYLKRILTLLLVWSVIYLPYSIKYMLPHDNIGKAILTYIHNAIFLGTYHHLWFYRALIFDILLVSFLVYKKWGIRHILLLSSFFYCIGLLFQSYFFLLSPLAEYAPGLYQFMLFVIDGIFDTTRNGLFEGFLFVSIGLFLSKKDLKLSKLASWILLLLSFLLMICEIFLIKKYIGTKRDDIFAILVPLVFLLFYTVRNSSLKTKPIYSFLRQISSLIYNLHLLSYYILNFIFTAAGAHDIFSRFEFLITLSTALLFGTLIVFLSRFPRLKFLKIIM